MANLVRNLCLSLFVVMSIEAKASDPADGPAISEWGTPCVADKNQTLQDFIDSGQRGYQVVPKDIEFENKERIYRSLKPTPVYIFPVKEKKFISYWLGCKFACGYKILSECEFNSVESGSWIIFRHVIDGTLLYLNKDDFALSQK